MKTKIISLTALAIATTQLLNYKDANAIVHGGKNPYQSEAIAIKGNISNYHQSERYKDHLNDLLVFLQAKKNLGYDENEYKDAYQKYQNKVLAEIEKLNEFKLEQDRINYAVKNKKPLPKNIFGLTHERYNAIFNSLKRNKEEFENEIKNIGMHNPDLREFNDQEQKSADLKVNELENKVLLIAKAFYQQNKVSEVEDLYNKLDMILGYEEHDRKLKKPMNQRMLNTMLDDLEYIIDEFFDTIKERRPKNINSLTGNSEKDEKNINSLLKDVKKAKYDESLRHSRKVEEQNNINSVITKKEYDEEYNNLRKKAMKKISSTNKDVVASISDEEDEPHEYTKKIFKSKKQKPSESDKKAESFEVNNSTIHTGLNNKVQYGPRPTFNSNVISNKNNISEYSNGKVQYGPRPTFNSNVISNKNNISEYSNGKVQYGPRPN